MLLAAAAVALAGFVQSATGLGLALVCGPALFAVLEPEEAITLILVLGVGINLLVLFGERGRRPAVVWGEVGPILAAAVPGVLAGALLIDALPKRALQAIVGVAVLAALLLRQVLRSRAARAGRAGAGAPQRGGRRGGAGAATAAARGALGLLCGTLTTLTNVNGPPLALWLAGRGIGPAAMRDSLNAAFLAFSLMGTAALVAIVGAGRSFDAAPALAYLLPALAAGYLAGRVAFRRLDARGFERAIGAVIAAAGLASLAGGLGLI